MGAVLSKLQGPADPAVPAFVGLAPKAGHPPYGSPGHPGFLGTTHGAFRPNGPSMDDMKLGDVSLERLADRRALLTGFDKFRRDLDASGVVEGMDDFTQQAFNVDLTYILSPKATLNLGYRFYTTQVKNSNTLSFDQNRIVLGFNYNF